MILRSSNVSNGEIVDADNVYVHPDVVNSENVQVGDIIVVVRNGSRSLMQTPKYMIPKAWLLDFVTTDFFNEIGRKGGKHYGIVRAIKQASTPLKKSGTKPGTKKNKKRKTTK